MKSFFKELFEYSHYNNQKLGDIFISNQLVIPEKTLSLYNHILNAHQIWNNRINPQQPAFGVWQNHPVEDGKSIDNSNHTQSLYILDTYDFTEIINYKSSKGVSFSNSIRDILFHIINHSTYHRAQIATAFRQAGIEPLNTDFIFYKR